MFPSKLRRDSSGSWFPQGYFRPSSPRAALSHSASVGSLPPAQEQKAWASYQLTSTTGRFGNSNWFPPILRLFKLRKATPGPVILVFVTPMLHEASIRRNGHGVTADTKGIEKHFIDRHLIAVSFFIVAKTFRIFIGLRSLVKTMHFSARL